jgi:hypothetical protein
MDGDDAYGVLQLTHHVMHGMMPCCVVLNEAGMDFTEQKL